MFLLGNKLKLRIPVFLEYCQYSGNEQKPQLYTNSIGTIDIKNGITIVFHKSQIKCVLVVK